MNVFQLNTNMNALLSGAFTGAALNAASGYVGGSSMTDKAIKGAIAGAAVVALYPTGANILGKIMPSKGPEKK